MDKVSRGEIYAAKPALDKFFEAGIAGIPSSVGIKLAILSRKADKEYATLEKERVRLITVYGVKDEKGNIEVPEEKRNEYFKEFAPLMEELIEAPMSEKIVLPDVEIPLDILKALEPFVKVKVSP